MSLAEITARIAQIQAQYQPMSVATSTSTSTSSSSVDFATTLSSALSGSTATSGTSSTGSSYAGTADGDDIAAWAKKFVGTPYVAGGRSPQAGWDCAGFTHWVAGKFGIDIPEVSWQQIKKGTAVSGLADAKPGDLLFFHEPGGHRNDPSSLKVNHVGIYLGNGKMVEAANPSAGTRVGPVDTRHLVGIRRIAPTGDGVARTPADVAGAAAVSAAPSVSATTGASKVGGTLGATALVDVLRKAGFTGEGLKTAWAVAMRESHGRPGAVSAVNSNGTRDHGLFQLNDIHLGRSIDKSQVYDADANAAAAYRMTKGGKNWSAWAIGSTGWAGHLQREAPRTYAQLNATFQAWYARFPEA